MKVLLALISSRRAGPTGATAELLRTYLERSSRYTPCEHRTFASEAKLLGFLNDAAARTRPLLLLADSSGQQLTSDEIAAVFERAFDSGVQLLVVGVGPADGWSRAALGRADRTVAFGRITLPHELAAVIAAEQIYRALTIRARHPYHSEH
jgi:23S rRNA (pseudouridine1915-N3)-methyltransferase